MLLAVNNLGKGYFFLNHFIMQPRNAVLIIIKDLYLRSFFGNYPNTIILRHNARKRINKIFRHSISNSLFVSVLYNVEDKHN